MQPQTLMKIAMGTAVSMAERQQLSKDIAELPMDQFIDECLVRINGDGVHWQAQRRDPLVNAESIARSKRLPSDLVDFYTLCDGLKIKKEGFPVPLFALANLRLGADFSPSLSQRLEAHWLNHDNPSEVLGRLAVMPPENLLALMNNEAECHLKPTVLDCTVPLFLDVDGRFAVVVLVDLSPTLRRGCVLDFEGGLSIRHDSFKSWLAHVTSVYESLPGPGTAPPATGNLQITPRKLGFSETLRRMRPRSLFIFLSFLAAIPWAAWNARRMLSRMQVEDEIVEGAPWIGRTGLDESTERELPRYLRREFGESLSDPDSLKASDLVYLGYEEEGEDRIYWWRIPERKFANRFASIVCSADGRTVTGWGDSSPSGKPLKQ
jgi:hypothetical protein